MWINLIELKEKYRIFSTDPGIQVCDMLWLELAFIRVA
jgi:hypothetical protein